MTDSPPEFRAVKIDVTETVSNIGIVTLKYKDTEFWSTEAH